MKQVRISYFDGSAEQFPSENSWEEILAEAMAVADKRGTAVKHVGCVAQGRYCGLMGTQNEGGSRFDQV